MMYCHGTKYRICVLAALRTVKLGLTKVGNEAYPLQYSKNKGFISYQFRVDVKTYGHRPRYTADNDAAETRVRSKISGCCCPNNTGNKILFRINWRRVNQIFNVAP